MLYYDLVGYDNNAHYAPAYVLSPVSQEVVSVYNPVEDSYNNSVDLNVFFKIKGSCASYNMALTEKVSGQADIDLNTGFVLANDTNYSKIYRFRNWEGEHTLRIDFNCPTIVADYLDVNFSLDLNAPTITGFGFDLNTTGFQSTLDANVYLICSDNIGPIEYHLALNDVNAIDGSFAPDSKQVDGVTILDLFNDLNALCIDRAGNYAVDSNVARLYFANFILINEDTGAYLNLADVNGAVVYTPDNNKFFDFKASATNQVSYLGDQAYPIRFEFLYEDALTGVQQLVTRNFTLGVLDLNVIRVCVVPRHLTSNSFYNHYLSSRLERNVAVYNPYRDCYIMGDTTRFVYQSSKLIELQLIDQEYDFFVWVDGTKTVLGRIDGTIASTEDIDALIQALTTYQTTLGTGSVGIGRPEGFTTQLFVYYRNIKEDNLKVKVDIYDGTTLVKTYTELEYPNDLNFVFDYTGITFSDNELKIVVTETKANGSTNTITKYFASVSNLASSVLNPGMAVIIAFILIIFGVTFVAYRYAVGWFGLIACMVALGVLALATPVWYVVLAQAVTIIISIFIVLIYRSETAGVA